MTQITADFSTLMDQAPMTASTYLAAARRSIDAEFGEGYAMKNPGLVGRFIDVCAQDFHTGGMGLAAQKIADAIIEISAVMTQIHTEE